MIRNAKGFTLLEILVAVAILSVLSFYTAQSIQKAVQSKVKIQGDIERTSTLRDAIKIIERDIQTAFNYRDPNIELHNRAGKEREKRAKTPQKPGADKGGTPDPADTQTPPPTEQPTTNSEKEPFQPKKMVILTHFIGETSSLHFTSLNNFRTQQNAQMSDQMEVGYFLRSCRNRVQADLSSQCLIRRTSSIIDDDVTKDGEEVALIENVVRFEARYLSYQENAEWQSAWRSDEGGDDITKNHFPLAVEITLETKVPGDNQKAKTLAMTIVAEIRNPNNPVPEVAEPGADGTVPAGGDFAQ